MTHKTIINSITIFYQHKASLLFLVLWLHVSMLDLFFVNYRGVVFLWQANSHLTTVLAHLVIALLTTFFYLFIKKYIQN